MSSDEQWRDAYEIAEQMYKESRSKKRTGLDLYQQIVCSRYDSVFSYDPVLDEYSFRNQALMFENPVASKCRPIADIDLTEMKKNTMSAGIEEPTYANLTPLHVVPPSTILVFNHNQHRAYGLTNALEIASESLVGRPTEREIQPGAMFIYKHKDQKCYRVLVLAEVGETNVQDADRRYEVAFLDVCQVIVLKLKNLHMLVGDLTLERFPCAVHCTRLVGIKMLRSNYISSYNDEVRKLYADKNLRKAGLSALIYKTEPDEQKLIVDFPSFLGAACTESSALKAVHGHHSTAEKDPIPLSYEDLIAKVLVPLNYKNEDEMSDSDYANLSSASTPKIPEEARDCPVGTASLDNFFAQTQLVVTTTFSPKKIDSKVISNDKPEDRSVSITLDTVCDSADESIASFRSAVVTPKPTFDVTGQKTPTKVAIKPSRWQARSPDGWGDKTPVKKTQVPPSPKKQPPTKEEESDDEWGDEDVKKPVFPVSSVRVGQPTVQRPLVAPKKPLPPSLMNLPLSKPSILPPPAQKPSSTSSRNSTTNIDSPTVQKPLKAPPSVNNDKDLILDHRSPTSTLPSVLFVDTEEHPVIETEKSPVPADTVCPVVGESPLNQTIVEKKQRQWGSPPEEAKQSELARNRKNGSSVGGSAVKSIKEYDLEDSVFLEQEETPSTLSAARRLSVLPDQQHPSPMASPNRDSTSSVNNHLIHASQASLPTDEEDGWEEPEDEVSKTKTETPKTDVVDQKAEMSESDQKKMTEGLCEALNAMNEKKKEGIKERIREHYKSLTSSRADSVSSVQNEKVDVVTPAEVVDDVSTKSNCPTVSDASERVFMEEPVDEVSSVPEALKQLADAFLTSIADAAYNKNRQAFISEVYALELIALKSPGDNEQRFWRKKLDEAKILEKSFD